MQPSPCLQGEKNAKQVLVWTVSYCHLHTLLKPRLSRVNQERTNTKTRVNAIQKLIDIPDLAPGAISAARTPPKDTQGCSSAEQPLGLRPKAPCSWLCTGQVGAAFGLRREQLSSGFMAPAGNLNRNFL